MSGTLHPTGGCSSDGANGRAMAGTGTADRPVAAASRRAGTAVAQQPGGAQRHRVDLADCSAMARSARAIPAVPDRPCQRRCQRGVREGTLERVLEALAPDLKERGQLDLSACCSDGTFIVAKQGAGAWERPSGAKGRS